MRSSHGLASLAPVLAVAGLVGLGATGYRMISGSCPFSCGASNVSLHPAPVAEGACPACCGSEEAEIVKVGATEAAAEPSCCSESEAKAAEPAAPSGL